MYSYEIDQYLRERNFDLSVSEYFFITSITANPQIKLVSRIGDNDIYIETKDEYNWIVHTHMD